MSKLNNYWSIDEIDKPTRDFVVELYSEGVEEIGTSDEWYYISNIKRRIDIPEDNTNHDETIRMVLNHYLYELQETNSARYD